MTVWTPTVAPATCPPPSVRSSAGRGSWTSSRSSSSTRRLVTLVGPGGAGKTRLALEVGERARADFADGVWLIEFAPLKSGSDVTCCRGHGTRSRRQRPFGTVRRRATDAVAVRQLRARDRRRCEPWRHSLLRCGTRRDVVWQPAASGSGQPGRLLYPLQSLEADEAAELFVERARAGGLPSEAVDQLDAIARICDQLDRMPLALELAAARTRSLSLDEIVERVEDRFALLTGGDRTAAASPSNTARCRRLELRAVVQRRATRLSIRVDLRRRIRSACR